MKSALLLDFCVLAALLVVADSAQRVRVMSHGFDREQLKFTSDKGVAYDPHRIRRHSDGHSGNMFSQDAEAGIFRQSKELLHLTDSRDELRPDFELQTVYGTKRLRVRQLYSGLRVFGVSTTIEYDSSGSLTGEVLGHVINGIQYDINDTDVSLTGRGALDILKSSRHPNASDSLIGKQDFEKIIYLKPSPNGDMGEGTAVVAWLVWYLHKGVGGATDSRPQAIIDGNHGDILVSWESLDLLRLTGVTLGNVRDPSPHVFNMHVLEVEPGICYYKSSKAEVMDMEGSPLSRRWDFLVRGFPCQAPLDKDYFDFTNGTYSPMSEVYLYSMYTHDMFMEYLGEPPLGNSSHTIIIKARAHINGCSDNAFFDGQTFNYGDGCDLYYPLTSMDVVAHEIAHGFTMYRSGLVYRGESGGLSEAFSDITGETAEYYIKTKNGLGENDWMIGNNLRIAGGALRYMDNPRADGVSLDHMDQYYSGISMHKSSGIINKAFYLLSNMPGWNIIKAFKAYATANLVYWEPETSFHCAACHLESAARDLGYPYHDVRASLLQVGVLCSECN